MDKKILFLTGTRADFGKLKPLIQILNDEERFEAHILATGMHMQQKYGYTYLEIEKCGFKNIHSFRNHTAESTMDLTLAKSIEGISKMVKELGPDLIVVHGDRVETLAGAIVGSLNNILVAHIEGGELSGTVDELIRHSVSKLSHIHFVANERAQQRLIQMGELEKTIFPIGSPDIDVMFSQNLPTLQKVKEYYDIPFDDYAVAIFHPVTTEADFIKEYISSFITALENDQHKYVMIFPNNDMGSSIILNEFKRLSDNRRFRIIPSLRFEYFLQLLKNAQFIIGNSSAGIREAPYYNIPSINIGSRQNNRSASSQILNCSYSTEDILKSIQQIGNRNIQERHPDFGDGNSAERFLNALNKEELWNITHQKQFRDLN